MLTCLECGKSGFKVLKHTHWRFKCTGRIKDANEYKQKYPKAEIISDNIKKQISHSESSFIKRHGAVNGKILWQAYCQKHSDKNTLAGYLSKGKTEEDWKAYNKAKSGTLENFKRRYGEQADQRWEEYCQLQSKKGKTLDWFISQHGYDVGLQIYESLNKQKGITPENMIRKHGYKEGMIRWHSWLESTNGTKISKLQRDIINKIVPLLPPSYYFHEGVFSSKEFVSYDRDRKRVYQYDFVITSPIKLCIEVNGDFYHANPIKYKAEDRLRHRGSGLLGKSAQEIWDYDKIKRETLEARGYECKVIWENDWYESQSNVLENVKLWLKLENHTCQQ